MSTTSSGAAISVRLRASTFVKISPYQDEYRQGKLFSERVHPGRPE
jgi:hypothetical protein